jgi:GT2 family glycosyltransferase
VNASESLVTGTGAQRTLAEQLATRGNDHEQIRRRFTRTTGLAWHAPTPARFALGTRLSVVIPARDRAYCLGAVLDALAAQETEGDVEVVVVDDGSVDGTGAVARAHPAVDVVVSLPRSGGAALARNVGTMTATSPYVLYLDADMVLPRHVLADVAARCGAGDEEAVLVGFREALPETRDADGMLVLPDRRPRLWNDYRVTFRAPAGVPLWYTGRVLDEATDVHALDDTDDFAALGHGATHYDLDLPRAVFSALVAARRESVLDVGGFETEFASRGWGFEDTHLAAKLIAAGTKVVPLRQAVGFHVYATGGTDAGRKRDGWRATLALFRELLDASVPSDVRAVMEAEVRRALADADVTDRRRP